MFIDYNNITVSQKTTLMGGFLCFCNQHNKSYAVAKINLLWTLIHRSSVSSNYGSSKLF